MCFDTLLRPGALVALRTEDVIPGSSTLKIYSATTIVVSPFARGHASKTGKFNLSVVLNTRHRKWLSSVLLDHRSTRPTKSSLFTLGQDSWRKAFLQAATDLNLAIPTLYVLRHGGASDAYLTGARTIEDIKKRGHWMSDKSVRRYEQAGWARQMVNNWPMPLRRHLELCHKCVEKVMLRQLIAPAFRKLVIEPRKRQKIR